MDFIISTGKDKGRDNGTPSLLNTLTSMNKYYLCILFCNSVAIR